MNRKLIKIFELEDNQKYNEAYHLYQEMVIESNSDFEVWKYYFFFLWSMIEDVEGIFKLKTDDLRKELERELENGLERYKEIAEFNFIVGYAINIFPYEFGDYEDLEILSNKMLFKATELEPKNLIYKMVYLGSSTANNQHEYKQAEIDAAPKVLEIYNGNGLMNNYFREILYRIDKKAYR